MAESRRKLPRWFWWTVVLIFGVPGCLLGLLLYLTAPHVDDPAALERFMNTTFTIPQEWITGATASAGLAAALEEVNRQEERLTSEGFNYSGPLKVYSDRMRDNRMTPEDWPNLEREIERAEPFRQALVQLLQRPDVPVSNLVVIVTFSRLHSGTFDLGTVNK